MRAKGNLGEALPLLERVLAIRKVTLGEDQEDTIKIEHILEQEGASDEDHEI